MRKILLKVKSYVKVRPVLELSFTGLFKLNQRIFRLESFKSKKKRLEKKKFCLKDDDLISKSENCFRI